LKEEKGINNNTNQKISMIVRWIVSSARTPTEWNAAVVPRVAIVLLTAMLLLVVEGDCDSRVRIKSRVVKWSGGRRADGRRFGTQRDD
jgi:hypothetical protein